MVTVNALLVGYKVVRVTTSASASSFRVIDACVPPEPTLTTTMVFAPPILIWVITFAPLPPPIIEATSSEPSVITGLFSGPHVPLTTASPTFSAAPATSDPPALTWRLYTPGRSFSSPALKDPLITLLPPRLRIF